MEAEKNRNATLIQKRVRGIAARRAESLKMKQHHAAVVIQTRARGRVAMKKHSVLKKERVSAAKIQSIARGRSGRRQASTIAAVKRKEEKTKTVAVRRIQRAERDRRERKRVQVQSATKVQSLARGRTARQRTAVLTAERAEKNKKLQHRHQEKETAARKIQGLERKRVQRKNREKASKSIQRNYRQIRSTRRNRSATHIQSVTRGRISRRAFLQRKLLLEQIIAATIIQSRGRMRLAQGKVKRKRKEQNSAITLQSQARGCLVRREQERQNAAKYLALQLAAAYRWWMFRYACEMRRDAIRRAKLLARVPYRTPEERAAFIKKQKALYKKEAEALDYKPEILTICRRPDRGVTDWRGPHKLNEKAAEALRLRKGTSRIDFIRSLRSQGVVDDKKKALSPKLDRIQTLSKQREVQVASPKRRERRVESLTGRMFNQTQNQPRYSKPYKVRKVKKEKRSSEKKKRSRKTHSKQKNSPERNQRNKEKELARLYNY
eukprot:g4824.t1